MKKLQIAKETRILLEDVIRENPKFRGNEELIDIFCEAIYKKSYLLVEAIKDKSRLKRHLAVICDSSITQILKEKERFTQSKTFNKPNKRNVESKIVSLKKTPFEENEAAKLEREQRKRKDIVNLKEEIQRSEKYDSVDVLIDPLEFCPPKKVSEKTLLKLINIVKRVDKKHPNKQYYDIFSYRYLKNINQMETARDLKISQVELSKRFVELIRLAREEV